MEYLLSRIHKLHALAEVLERYVNENKEINVYTIKSDAKDILSVVEDIVNHEFSPEEREYIIR